ncbi:aldolase/citrate lyase family protein [Novosphingobium album (ex Liu et al. 2023)]|uniref:Aldolase/citrate lyase family protein n=1 Tax=Novosphingobium album (ex Liu et al. 2023) TaxID=3031130 RepID=A0ABT5WQL8_9SPHN|nr:aldolase/citrate lyase family protein [Novosphingobium album (ex Liu et al. 2023)]MDE8652340.1 aldolase/citrate lyase family protein [Novosphingobium album (ex Liu et al. 2023)]
MNTSERAMLDMLRKGRDDFGVVAVKAEFEAEGTRPDELLRLLELAHRADLGVAIKIGGCEAVSDLLASRLYGADYIIAPMVETPYALTKFVEARAKTWGEDAHNAKFLFNLETQSTLANLEAMLPVAAAHLDGIVFGRVDFTLSCGLPRGAINTRQVTDAVLAAAGACADNDLELVVGGSVALEAVAALREIRQVRLDRFETRKVVFDGAAAESARFEEGIANAVAFELAWLENKRDYYRAIADEDLARIRMMQERSATAARARIASLAA